jgi:hypothetical protein
MTKVRIGHEDVSIGKNYTYRLGIPIRDEIQEKYHFDFNSRCVFNTNPTKRISIPQIKVFNQHYYLQN